MRSAAVRVSSRLLSKSRTGSCVQSLNGPAFTTHSHTISYTRCTCAHRPQLPTGVREHVRAAVAVDPRGSNLLAGKEGALEQVPIRKTHADQSPCIPVPAPRTAARGRV